MLNRGAFLADKLEWTYALFWRYRGATQDNSKEGQLCFA